MARYAPRISRRTYVQDELRYRIRHELFLRPDQTTFTFRNKMNQTALPIRSWGAFMPPNGVGGGGVHWNAETWRFLPSDFVLRTPSDAALRRALPAAGHDHSGLGRHLRGARATLRPVRISLRHLGHGRQSAGPDSGRRQSVRGTALARPIRIRPRSSPLATRSSPRPRASSATNPSRNPPAICRAPTGIRWACGSGPAPIAASANGSAAPTTPRRARRRPFCRC